MTNTALARGHAPNAEQIIWGDIKPGRSFKFLIGMEMTQSCQITNSLTPILSPCASSDRRRGLWFLR